MRDYAYNIQPNSVTVHFLDGDYYTWPLTHPKFEETKAAIRNASPSHELKALMDVGAQIVEAFKVSPLASSMLEVSRRGVFFNGKELRLSVASRIISMLSNGEDATPQIAFLEKLLKNPFRNAVESLFDFIDHNQIPLTDDGDFIVYKRVRGDYKDIYSGTYDNTPGKSPRCLPWEVVEDREQTCAPGLHVCSRAYLPNFGTGAGNRVVICKVNPADVVSVPRDYNNSKMRVCGYDVIGELSDAQKAEILDQQTVLDKAAAKSYATWHDWEESYDNDDYYEEDEDYNEDEDEDYSEDEDEDADDTYLNEEDEQKNPEENKVEEKKGIVASLFNLYKR